MVGNGLKYFQRFLSVIESVTQLTLEAKARAVQNKLPLTPLFGSWLAVARAVNRAVGQVVVF